MDPKRESASWKLRENGKSALAAKGGHILMSGARWSILEWFSHRKCRSGKENALG
jgi:hypothetical protein